MSRFILLLIPALSIFLIQKPAPIVLKDEKIAFTPHEFYITDVTDERKERNSIGSFIINHSQQSIDLQGGAARSIKLFIDHNLQPDAKLRPVVITIDEFKLTEKVTNGRIIGDLSARLSFSLQKPDTTVHLLDYNGGIHYERDAAQTDVAEPAIRHTIENAVAYFNKWMDKQADDNLLLAKSVKVSFIDHDENNEGDTIYYSVKRPLNWDDFKDKPRTGRFDAEVFPAIGYSEQAEVISGVIHLNISLKVNMLKSDCWVKPGSRTDYALNHEQRHFDLEKLVSEHFKQKILAMKLSPDNFDGPINVEYLETLREATRLQKQYDTETNHGTDRTAQEVWDEKIDKELLTYGIKK